MNRKYFKINSIINCLTYKLSFENKLIFVFYIKNSTVFTLTYFSIIEVKK